MINRLVGHSHLRMPDLLLAARLMAIYTPSPEGRVYGMRFPENESVIHPIGAGTWLWSSSVI